MEFTEKLNLHLTTFLSEAAFSGDGKSPSELAFYSLLELFRGHPVMSSSSNEADASAVMSDEDLEVIEFYTGLEKFIEEAGNALVFQAEAPVNLGSDLLTFSKEAALAILAPTPHAFAASPEVCKKTLLSILLFYKSIIHFSSGKVPWIKSLCAVMTSVVPALLQCLCIRLRALTSDIFPVVNGLQEGLLDIYEKTDNDGVFNAGMKFLHALVLLYSPGISASESIEEAGLLFFEEHALPGITLDSLRDKGETSVSRFVSYLQAPLEHGLSSTTLTALLNLTNVLIRKRPSLIPVLLPNYLYLFENLERQASSEMGAGRKSVTYSENQIKSIRHSLKQQLTMLAKLPPLRHFKGLIEDALSDMKAAPAPRVSVLATKDESMGPITPSRSILKRGRTSTAQTGKRVRFSEALIDARPEPTPRRRSPSPPPPEGRDGSPMDLEERTLDEQEDEEDASLGLDLLMASEEAVASASLHYEKELLEEMERKITKKRQMDRQQAKSFHPFPLPVVVELLVRSFRFISQRDIDECIEVQGTTLESLRAAFLEEKAKLEERHRSSHLRDIQAKESQRRVEEDFEAMLVDEESTDKKPLKPAGEGEIQPPTSSDFLARLFSADIPLGDMFQGEHATWLQMTARSVTMCLLGEPESSLSHLQDFIAKSAFLRDGYEEDQEGSGTASSTDKIQSAMENEAVSMDEKMLLTLLVAYRGSLLFSGDSGALLEALLPILFGKLVALGHHYMEHRQDLVASGSLITLDSLVKRLKLGKWLRLMPALPLDFLREYLTPLLFEQDGSPADSSKSGEASMADDRKLPTPLRVFQYQLLLNGLLDTLLYRDKKTQRLALLPLLLSALVSPNTLLRKTAISLTYSKLFIRLAQMKEAQSAAAPLETVSAMELEKIILDFGTSQLGHLLSKPPSLRTTFKDYTIELEAAETMYAFSEASDPMDASEETMGQDQVWHMEHLACYLDNFFALCRLYPSYLLAFLPIYGSLTPSQQAMTRALMEPLMKPLFDAHPEAFMNAVFLNEGVVSPDDPTGLLLRMIHMLAKGMGSDLHPILLSSVLQMVSRLSFSHIFLMPVLHGLDKADLLSQLPGLFSDLLDWQAPETPEEGAPSKKHRNEALIKDALRKCVNPMSKGALTPVELLIQVHLFEAKIGVKKVNTLLTIILTPDLSSASAVASPAAASPALSPLPAPATQEKDRSLSMTEIFTYEVVAAALQQLSDRMPLPSTLLKTILLTLSNYREKAKFILQILSKLVTRKVWTNELLWEGFIRCCQLLQPLSRQVMIQLPLPQLTLLLKKVPDFKGSLKAYLDAQPPSFRQRFTSILPLLEPSK